MRARALVRSWWPVPVMLAVVLALQVIWTGRYQVSGHAAEHLANATVLFGMSFVVAVILWAVPPCSRSWCRPGSSPGPGSS